MTRPPPGDIDVATLVMSCAARAAQLQVTLGGLHACRWPGEPEIVLDDGVGATPLDRIHRTWRRMLRRTAASDAPLALLLEDDVVFGRHFPHNLLSWRPLHEIPPSRAFYASLYNPSHPFISRRADRRCLVADPRYLWGAQALVMTPATARFIDAHWSTAPGNPDQRMPRIAARVTSIYVHDPSLVDHAPVPTTWGGSCTRRSTSIPTGAPTDACPSRPAAHPARRRRAG